MATVATQKRLPDAQERRLLKAHTTGDFSGPAWSTIVALIKSGMVIENTAARRLEVTPKGREYCDRHHADIVTR